MELFDELGGYLVNNIIDLDKQLDLPESKVAKMRRNVNLHSPSQRIEAYLDLYATGHPCPSWRQVAVALHNVRLHHQARTVESTYVQGTCTAAIVNITILIIYHWMYLTIYNEKYFRRSFFLYSPCPNLEGINDALCYKFRKPTVGQNCSAMCTNKVSHRAAFLNKRREVPHVSKGLLSRPPSLERSKRRGLFFVIAWW